MAIALAYGGKPGSMRAMSNEQRGNGTQVVIAGGGVAGLETLLALADLAGERVALTLVAPQPDFVYKPLLVEEPFDLGPAERHELEPLAAEKGAKFILSAVSTVRPEDHLVEFDDDSTLQYD
jgi:sulfide:quinone oxidoreductase